MKKREECIAPVEKITRRSPRWRIRHGDCLDHLPRLRANSVDAIVTDPPYGLEFMGKDWDRLGDVGKSSHQGFGDDPGFKGFRLASYSGSSNVRCGRCRRWKWDHEGRKCECGQTAIWPNVKALEGRRMQDWHESWAREALRVLKPGGHLLAFGGTRTYHRLACAVEDAGFEIRDCIVWLYGSGFPKSLDVGKAIDRELGQPRRVAGVGDVVDRVTLDDGGATGKAENGLRAQWSGSAPNTPEAERWEGWGTALKPGHEPIVLARKPLTGTVAANVLAHGTGAINIDACRIDLDDAAEYARNHSGARGHNGTRNPEACRATNLRTGGGRPKRVAGGRDTPGKNTGSSGPGGGSSADGSTMLGRWPANVALDAIAAAELDEETGVLVSGANPTRRNSDKFGTAYGKFVGGETCEPARGVDIGGASRFYYCAKASRGERNAGLSAVGEPLDNAKSSAVANNHPTVKPIKLLRWLIRLVTPSGGVVLDCFAGSGTTGCAAILEGFRFIGIERETGYVEIARGRIKHWAAESSR